MTIPSVETLRQFLRQFDTHRFEVSMNPVSLTGRETDSSTADSTRTALPFHGLNGGGE
jgi:hypothetical protein